MAISFRDRFLAAITYVNRSCRMVTLPLPTWPSNCGAAGRIYKLRSRQFGNLTPNRGIIWEEGKGTLDRLTAAMLGGQTLPATNQVNSGHSASRYIHPTTGRSVSVDDVAGEVIHVGGDGFLHQ